MLSLVVPFFSLLALGVAFYSCFLLLSIASLLPMFSGTCFCMVSRSHMCSRFPFLAETGYFKGSWSLFFSSFFSTSFFNRFWKGFGGENRSLNRVLACFFGCFFRCLILVRFLAGFYVVVNARASENINFSYGKSMFFRFRVVMT